MNIEQSQERAFLVYSRKELIKHLENFIDDFRYLERVEFQNFNTQWQINLQNLSAQVDEFLKNAFSRQSNEYRQLLVDATFKDFKIIVLSNIQDEVFKEQYKKFIEQVQVKIHALEELKARSEFMLITPVAHTKSNGDDFTLQEIENIKLKIDHVLETLIKGEEIIYQEIEELKNSLKYPKKTFDEILKGKLVSLAFDKALTQEHIKWLYNQISGDTLPNLLN